MDEFASFNENFVLALIAVLLLMAMWGCAILAIDHWVWAGRSNSPRPGQGGRGIALQNNSHSVIAAAGPRVPQSPGGHLTKSAE